MAWIGIDRLPGLIRFLNCFAPVENIGIRGKVFYVNLDCIHLCSHIKILFGEMPLCTIQDICLNPPASYMAKIEEAVPALSFT